MSALSPLMCGQWDGCNLWVQWSPLRGPGTRDVLYKVRTRLRARGTEWGAWTLDGAPSPRCWRVVQTMREGWEIQCQVCALLPDAEPQWEGAAEVTFVRSRAKFRFTLAEGMQPVRVRHGRRVPARDEKGNIIGETIQGDILSAVVDGAGASFFIPFEPAFGGHVASETVFFPGEPREVEMESLHFTPFAQLDHPGHFRCEPAPGLVVENVSETVNDVTPTDSATPCTTRLSHLKHPGGPMVVVKTGKNWFRKEPKAAAVPA